MSTIPNPDNSAELHLLDCYTWLIPFTFQNEVAPLHTCSSISMTECRLHFAIFEMAFAHMHLTGTVHYTQAPHRSEWGGGGGGGGGVAPMCR